jgi:hypothetical protein
VGGGGGWQAWGRNERVRGWGLVEMVGFCGVCGGGEIFMYLYLSLLPRSLDHINCAKPAHLGDQAVNAHSARVQAPTQLWRGVLVYRVVPYVGTMTERSLASRMKAGRMREHNRRGQWRARGGGLVECVRVAVQLVAETTFAAVGAAATGAPVLAITSS